MVLNNAWSKKVFSRPDILKRDAGDYIDSNVPEQLFEDLSEVTVDFKPIEVWHVGQEMVIEFTLPADYEEGGGDWIGIFKVNELIINYKLKTLRYLSMI